MHRYERFARRVGDCLGFCHTDKKRADKSRSVSDRDGIHLFQCLSGIRQCLPDHRIDLLYMAAGRDFRHHAAIERMDIDL